MSPAAAWVRALTVSALVVIGGLMLAGLTGFFEDWPVWLSVVFGCVCGLLPGQVASYFEERAQHRREERIE